MYRILILRRWFAIKPTVNKLLYLSLSTNNNSGIILEVRCELKWDIVSLSIMISFRVNAVVSISNV